VTNMVKVLLVLEQLELNYKPIKIFENGKPVITPGTIAKQ